MKPADSIIHPAWLRWTHWVNVVAVVLMVSSGWRIFDASPFWGLHIPEGITLGGWLGGALQWHFAAMWLLAVNGLVYLLLNAGSGRFKTKYWPIAPRRVWADLRAALAGRLAHDNLREYNAVQRVAYLFIVLDLVVLVMSGLVMWKSVQFPLLRELMLGYEGARRVHFVAMALLVAFVAGHVVMAALVPRTLLAMVRGR